MTKLSPDLLAWGVYLGAALLTLFAWWHVTKRLRLRGLREVLRAVVAVLLFVPWRVPQQPDHFAPAVVVAIFESAFQSNGDPLPAVTALVGAALLLIGLLFARRLFLR